MFSPDLLVSRGIFDNVESVYFQLKEKLINDKAKLVRYFRNQNQNNPERIAEFESVFDNMVANPQENMPWIKSNIKGHSYFNYTQSRNIPYIDYVDELPITAFADIIRFFDGIEYFSQRINHDEL